MNIRFRALTRGLAIKPEAVIQAATDEMRSYGNDLINLARAYPPVPQGSKYERTMNLQDSWHESGPRVTGGGLVLRVINDMPYARFVQGEDQTWFHEAHGWKKISELADRGEYRNRLQHAIRRAI